MTETAGCDDRVVRSCESPKPTSVVITIAKATTIEKKYARRENTITAAPSRTLLYCIKTRSPGTFTQQPQTRPAWRRSWLACIRIMAGPGSRRDDIEPPHPGRHQLL